MMSFIMKAIAVAYIIFYIINIIVLSILKKKEGKIEQINKNMLIERTIPFILSILVLL